MPDDDLAELLERISGVCSMIEARLDAVECEMEPPIPAKLGDSARRDSGGNEPVVGSNSSELLARTLEAGM